MNGIPIKDIDDKIRLLKQTAEDLKQTTTEIPAIQKNADRILASIKMLEINISDIRELF